MEWYYAKGEAPSGPHPQAEIEKLIASRSVSRETLAWRKGLTEWQPLGDIEAYNAAFARLPPPLPFARTPPPAPAPPPVPAAPIEPDDLPPVLGTPHPASQDGTVSHPSADGGMFAQGPWSSEVSTPIGPGQAGLPLAGPWSRYFARQFDLTVIGFFAVLGISFGLPEVWRPIEEMHEAGAGIVVVAIASAINALIFALVGTSLGKALFGIDVIRVDGGDPPGFFWRIVREIKVWSFGLALGLPIISLIPLLTNFREVKDKRPARYDFESAAVLTRHISDFRRGAAMVLAIAVVFGSYALGKYLEVSSRSQASSTRQTERVVPPAALERVGRVAPVATSTERIQWTNTVTGDAVYLPAGWTLREPEPGESPSLAEFISPDRHMEVYIGAEEADTMMLFTYQRALEENLSSSIDMFGDWERRDVWGKTVYQRNAIYREGRYQASYSLWKEGDRIWRLIVIHDDPMKVAVHPQSLPLAKAVLATVR